MTTFVLDVSSYQEGLVLQPGTAAVIVKATQGTYYRDRCYADFKTQAARVGAAMSAYHFLTDEDPAAQAEECIAMVGKGIPTMVDVEPTGNSRPTVWHCSEFANKYRELGGLPWGSYFPEWYWQEVGGDLSALRAMGLVLISSLYDGAYSDSGPGWDPYGGGYPVLWQYTNKQAYGGQLVDFNAFRGTPDQLVSVFNGGTMLSPADIDAIATATALKVWEYKGNNGDPGFGPDAPDVHQTALSTRDAVSELQAASATQGAELQTIAAAEQQIAAKVGA